MNYITSTLLGNRVGSTRLSNLCSSSGVVEEIIARAEGIVDGYASVRYATPLTATPIIKEWVLAIAEYELYKRGPGSQVPDKIEDTYRTTLEQLSELSKGKIGTGAALLPRVSSAPVCVLASHPSVME